MGTTIDMINMVAVMVPIEIQDITTEDPAVMIPTIKIIMGMYIVLKFHLKNIHKVNYNIFCLSINML